MSVSANNPRLLTVILTLAAVLGASGCYHGTARPISADQAGVGPGWVVVGNMQLIPQTADRDCGAAALAMMLRHWSVPVSKDEIWRTMNVEPGRGIAAGALRNFAVQRGLHAFLISGELTDLVNEVGLDRPVLVGLIQRYGDRSLAHYEVVTGINQNTRRILLLDPAHGLREDGFDGFLVEWNAAGRPTLVIVSS